MLASGLADGHLDGVTIQLNDDLEWRVTPGLVDYPDSLATMSARVDAIASGTAREMVWLLEHPPLYTGGTSADAAELLDPRFPVFASGRGGRYTYHGPGQRVGYLMIDLDRRGRDVRHFVHSLEGWLIAALARIGIDAFRAPGRVGIWTMDGGQEAKIGAIGIRVKRWVTMHGFALNIAPELGHFGGIVPCGIADFGVTSVDKLGKMADFQMIDDALAFEFAAFMQTLSCRPENEA